MPCFSASGVVVNDKAWKFFLHGGLHGWLLGRPCCLHGSSYNVLMKHEYSKFVTEDIKSRFACGEQNLPGKTKKCKKNYGKDC